MRIFKPLFSLMLLFSFAGSVLQAKIAESNPTATKVEAWNKALEALFQDKACTVLKPEFAGLTQEQMKTNENYQALPPTLQNMVLKMTTDGTWDEESGVEGKPKWDAEYAKRLRVQLIEPYSNKEAAAAALRINSHTNLNNPLGVYANSGQTLFIMVEGDIKDGASLYLPTWSGHGKPGNDYDEGLQLKPGLNALKVSQNDLTGCVNYVVHTMNSAYGAGNKACVRKLSDYDDIKIHIEGGFLNGFYNVVGDELWGEGDTNEDWDYYAARAGQTDLTVLGRFVTLQFPLFGSNEITEGNPGMDHYLTGKNVIEDMIVEWDNVMLSELMVMGLAKKEYCDSVNAIWKSPYSDKKELISHLGNATDGFKCDYDDYYRVHGLGFGVGGSAYMYGGYDHCGYHFNTMGSIMVDIITSSGSHWGPGHEIGHQHQGPLTLNGQTEVTNNLFANVALWCFGISTSRVNGSDGMLENVAKAFCTPGGDFYTNNIWALTHMYYRLFCYYHILGHNTEFYPRLYEMLRQDPMRKAYMQDGDQGLLHIYKKMCDAAGEDLTEFFRAHGMLTPMTDRLVGDYANSIYNTTKEQIDAAIQEVKSKGYKENLAPLFINDGTGEEVMSWRGQKLDLYDGTPTASVGNYAHFDSKAGDYTYKVADTYLTLTGSGGIGYLIRNDKGEIVAFSNKKKMWLSDAAALLIAQGKAKVEIMNADNTTVEATGDVVAAQKKMLQTILNRAEDITSISDDTNTKVGYYKESELPKLKEFAKAAQEVYDGEETEKYAEAYTTLYAEVNRLENDESALVGIVNGSAYHIINDKSPNQALSISTTSNKVLGQTKSTKRDVQKWILEKAGSDKTYYIKNKATNTYVDVIEKSENVMAQSNTPSVEFQLVNMGEGSFALVCQDGDYLSFNYNSSLGVIGWSYEGDNGSWWKLTALEINQAEMDKIELEETINKTRDLLTEMGDDVILPGELPLQADNAEADFYIFSNADQNVVGDGNDGGGVKALLDGKTTTYFHSQWSGTPVKETHSITVDLGAENVLGQVMFRYATRNADASSTSPAPTSITLKISADGKKFTTLRQYTNSGTNPLPSYRDAGAYWTSDVLTRSPQRYFRLEVTASAGPANSSYGGKAFFAMSEFALLTPQTVVNSMKPQYQIEGIEEVYKDVATIMFQSSQVLEDEDATAEELAAALENVEEAYQALVAASQGELSVGDIVANKNAKKQGIYDLSGRKINKVAQPGIYVINGKKQFVK